MWEIKNEKGKMKKGFQRLFSNRAVAKAIPRDPSIALIPAGPFAG